MDNLVQKIKGFSRYEIDMTDFFDVKVFSLNYRNTGRRQQLVPGNHENHLLFKILNDEGKYVVIYIHQLVWRQFYGEIPKGYAVHHVNFNPNDNRPENLVLLSHSEHAKLHNKLRIENGNAGACKMKKKCLQFDKEGNLIKEFESITEASRVTGIPSISICYCCKHKYGYKSRGGYIWMYKDEYLNTQTQQDQ